MYQNVPSKHFKILHSVSKYKNTKSDSQPT